MLSDIVTEQCNHAISSRIFPDSLKEADDSRNEMGHYQPVSILPAYLKELRNRILSNILVRLLFCLIRLCVGLHFLHFFFTNLVSRLSVLSLNQGIKICVIILCNFDM